jgi:tripartite-type tricarboxylate transporter receptor subunit TctC
MARHRVTAALVAALVPVLAVLPFAGAQAQTYPERPIKMLVPFAAGGPTDSLGRLLADRMATGLRQPTVIENRPGAGGLLAADAIAKGPADGYTVFLTGQTTFTSPLTVKSDLDPQKELAAVAQLVFIPLVIAIPVSAPFRDLPAMIAYAKANPGKLTYGLSAHAGTDHLGFGLLERMASIQLTSVPYKGASAVLPDLLAHRVDLQISTPALFAEHEQAGKLRMIAALSPKRIPLAAHVPTVAEQGYPGYDIPATFAVFVRAGTPRPIIGRLEAEMKRIIELQDMAEPLRKLTLVPDFLPADATAEAMRNAYTSTRTLMQQMGFKLN